MTLALALAGWLAASVIATAAVSLVLQGRSRFNPEPAGVLPVQTEPAPTAGSDGTPVPGPPPISVATPAVRRPFAGSSVLATRRVA